ncbi:MAG: hypothetical protein Q4B17_09705 [Lautropia sp.]|nr:hypothetical protein [Lautropia sp.]
MSQRTPVGYQRDFLDSYQPNQTFYLPEPLRRQLHQTGRTPDIHRAAGTHSRAILNRLLIDLSWASSHLEGNTYTRLDTLELITHGKAAVGKAAIETQMILNHKAAIELLRDLYVWAYQRSAQEYLAIRQGLAEPDPLRLAWGKLIKTSIHGIVTQGLQDPLPFIRKTVQAQVPEAEQASVQALIIEELRRRHEGVLARYGLRPAEYQAYRSAAGLSEECNALSIRSRYLRCNSGSGSSVSSPCTLWP